MTDTYELPPVGSLVVREFPATPIGSEGECYWDHTFVIGTYSGDADDLSADMSDATIVLRDPARYNAFGKEIPLTAAGRGYSLYGVPLAPDRRCLIPDAADTADICSRYLDSRLSAAYDSLYVAQEALSDASARVAELSSLSESFYADQEG